MTVPTDYAGNYVYENGTLQFFSTPEGYVEPKDAADLSQGYNYIYQYKDHLGNVRLSYSDVNGDGEIKVTDDEILEENNYYPFGLEHKGYNNVVNSTNPAQDYKYNGKEYEEDLGKDTYAYGWRDYDPAIGRFNKMDRFAEKYYGLSPYNYTANDPVSMVDIAGDSISVKFYDENKKRLSSIPKAVQKMFNSEYGIKVGYNSKTGMLYYAGEVQTDNTVSESAKDIIVGALKETDGKKIKGFGTITFGYNLEKQNGAPGGIFAGGSQRATRQVGIDLADFQSDGTVRGLIFNNVDKRAWNMGRVFEHEWIGHILNGAGDNPIGRRDEINPGGAADVVNVFRKEMGLPIRISYGARYHRGAIFFGNNNLSKKSAKATAKSYLRRLNKYIYKRKGSVSDIPMILYPKRN